MTGMLPNLVIAGAPKCGTSSLFRWLADHPDALGSSVKETCYFADPGTHTYNEKANFLSGGLEGYGSFFSGCDPAPALIVEATPAYLYSSLALRELPRLPSRPIVLFVLREPVSQIKSVYSYYRGNWNWIPHRMGFRDFVQASLAEADLFKDNELVRFAIRNARYVDFLVKWRDACGADRVHVLVFEDAFRDPRSTMKRLATLLGLTADFYDTYDFPRENESYAPRSRSLQKVNLAVRSMVPKGGMYNALRAAYRKINTRPRSSGDWSDDACEAALGELFAISNQRLESLFGLDLGAWASLQSRRVERTRGTRQCRL